MDKKIQFAIAQRGLYSVNIPVVVIIFASWFALLYTNSLGFQKCALIAGAMGWIYWEFAIVKWIRWSLMQGIDKTELYKIGKRNLLVWSEYKINKISEEINKTK